jgi:hypothetical protein
VLLSIQALLHPITYASTNSSVSNISDLLANQTSITVTVCGEIFGFCIAFFSFLFSTTVATRTQHVVHD